MKTKEIIQSSNIGQYTIIKHRAHYILHMWVFAEGTKRPRFSFSNINFEVDKGISYNFLHILLFRKVPSINISYLYRFGI